eukprot:866019_1
MQPMAAPILPLPPSKDCDDSVNKWICTSNVTDVTTQHGFELAAAHIAMNLYTSVTTVNLFVRLKSIMYKLITKHDNDDMRYRSLLAKKVIRHKGVGDFLILLGFEFEGVKLNRNLTRICLKKPSICMIRNAMRALTTQQLKFGFGNVTICEDKNDKLNKLLFERNTHMVSGYLRVNMIVYHDELVHLIALWYHQIIRTVTTIHNHSDAHASSTLSIEQILQTEDKTANQNAMRTILLVHKLYMDSVALLKHIRNIFNDTSTRFNVLRVLQLWLQLYLDQDFKENDVLKDALEQWFDEQLLDDTYREKHGVNKDLCLSNIISSIHTYYNQLQCAKHEEIIHAMDLLSVINEKQHTNNQLLVIGYLRTQSHRILPIELHALFVLYFHDTEIPKGATALSASVSDIAEQLTWIDAQLLNNIQDREFLDHNWKRRDNKRTNLLKMIDHFNHITKFVQMQILNETTLRNRAKTLKKLIKVGMRLMELRNYNTLCAFHSALSSAPIHRLKAMWNRVPQRYMTMVRQIKDLFDRNDNHCNLRRKLSGATVDEPHIPYMGLLLQDLVFVDDGGARSVYDQNRINFHKMLQINETIQRVMVCKGSYDGKITEQLMTQRILLQELKRVKDVTEDQIWDISTRTKRGDTVESTKELQRAKNV